MIKTLYHRKSVSNLNFSLVFFGKIKLNVYYKKMTQNMYGNLQEKYRNSFFKILKLFKAFNNFDFNLTVKKKIHWVVQMFGNKVIGRFLLTSQTEHPN